MAKPKHLVNLSNEILFAVKSQQHSPSFVYIQLINWIYFKWLPCVGISSYIRWWRELSKEIPNVFVHNAEFLYLGFLSKDCLSSSNHEAHYGRMWKQKESKWDICISGHLTPQPSHHGGQILLFYFSTPPKSDREVNSVYYESKC